MLFYEWIKYMLPVCWIWSLLVVGSCWRLEALIVCSSINEILEERRKKKVWVIGLSVDSVQPVDCSSNEIAIHGLKTTLFMPPKKKKKTWFEWRREKDQWKAHFYYWVFPRPFVLNSSCCRSVVKGGPSAFGLLVSL